MTNLIYKLIRRFRIILDCVSDLFCMMSENENEVPPHNAPPPPDVHANPAAEGGGGGAMDMDGL